MSETLEQMNTDGLRSKVADTLETTFADGRRLNSSLVLLNREILGTTDGHYADADSHALYASILGFNNMPGHLQTLAFTTELLESYGVDAERIETTRVIRSGMGELMKRAGVRRNYLLTDLALDGPKDEQNQPRVSDATLYDQLGKLLDTSGLITYGLVSAHGLKRRNHALDVSYLFPKHEVSDDASVFVGSPVPMLELGSTAAAAMLEFREEVSAQALPDDETRGIIQQRMDDLAPRI